MKIFIDCEFNGFGGDLISMALVDQNGKFFYQVLDCENPVPWVKENVMPILINPPISESGFKNALKNWLYQYKEIDLYADHPADLVHFCQSIMLGNEGDWMALPKISMNLAPELGAYDSALPHNALEDARGLRERAKYIGLI